MFTELISNPEPGTLAPILSEIPSSGLDADDEHVGLEPLRLAVSEWGVRRGIELDGDLGHLQQPLACPDVKGVPAQRQLSTKSLRAT